MRLTIVILLCLIYGLSNAQPAYVLHRSYAAKVRYVDSMHYVPPDQPEKTLCDLFFGLSDWARRHDDKELAILSKLEACRVLFNNSLGNTVDIIGLLQQLLNEAQQNNFTLCEADVLQGIGQYYAGKRIMSQAIEYFLEANSIYAGYSPAQFPSKRVCLHALAGMYNYYGDEEKAFRTVYAAETTATTLTDMYANSIDNTLGVYLRRRGEFDSAEKYFRKVYNNAVRKNDKPWIGISIGNIGICYYLQKRYKEAIPLLEQDIENGLTNHQVKNAVNSIYYLAENYYALKDYKKAEALLKKGHGRARTVIV